MEKKIAWSVALVGGTLLALSLANLVRADETPKAPEFSADYQKGWCAGWRAAATTVTIRRNLWRQNMEAVSPADKWPDQIRSVFTGIDAFLLLQEQTGKVQMGDGSTIDCAVNR